MNRKTLLAGAVFIGLLAITMLVLREPEKGTRTGDAPRPVAAIGEGNLDTLEITRDGKKVAVKREGGKFTLVEPIAYPAEEDSAKQAFEAIEKAEFGSIVSDQKSKHDEFEVGAKSPRVVAKKGGKVLADLRIGKVSPDHTMVRVEGKDEVWQLVGSHKWHFDREPAAWRDKSITTFASEDAERLEVVSKDQGKIVLTRPARTDAGVAAAWKVAESNVKAEPFDPLVANEMLTGLYAFKANDFADGVSPAESGLDAPNLTVTVGLKGGKSETVLIGKKKTEDDYYVKRAAGPQVFLVKKYNLERINKRPIEFKDKTICNIDSQDVTQVSVTAPSDSYTLVKDASKGGHDAGGWKLSKPAGVTIDPAKATSIVTAFREWKATSFAEDSSPKTTGLVKPSATILATGKNKSCQVKLGAELPDKQNRYASVAGAPEVYVLPKWSVDRIVQKIDDLEEEGRRRPSRRPRPRRPHPRRPRPRRHRRPPVASGYVFFRRSRALNMAWVPSAPSSWASLSAK